jgi:YD repeat-containing protein
MSREGSDFLSKFGVDSFDELHKKFVYNELGQCIYVGSAVRGKSTADTQAWTLFRFTYDGSGNCIEKQVAFDSWDRREVADYE